MTSSTICVKVIINLHFFIVISEFHGKRSTVFLCLPYLIPFEMFLPEKGITVNPTDTKGRQLKRMFRWRKANNTKQMDFVNGYFDSLWQRILLFDCSYDLRTNSRRQIATYLRNMYQSVIPESKVNKLGKGHRNTYVRLCRRIYYCDIEYIIMFIPGDHLVRTSSS